MSVLEIPPGDPSGLLVVTPLAPCEIALANPLTFVSCLTLGFVVGLRCSRSVSEIELCASCWPTAFCYPPVPPTRLPDSVNVMHQRGRPASSLLCAIGIGTLDGCPLLGQNGSTGNRLLGSTSLVDGANHTRRTQVATLRGHEPRGLLLFSRHLHPSDDADCSRDNESFLVLVAGFYWFLGSPLSFSRLLRKWAVLAGSREHDA